jgi:hypothetical protein
MIDDVLAKPALQCACRTRCRAGKGALKTRPWNHVHNGERG